MKYYKPPASVAREARLGLEYRKQFGRGGTAVGIHRARTLKNQSLVSENIIKRMYSYFRRHEVDKKSPHWDKPSNGKIAWLLWGGDSGYRWVANILGKHYV